MNTSLKIAELSKKLQSLVGQTYQVLEATNNDELKKELREELDALKNRTDLKVAFVGQYNSGKSTIISALTGNKEIEIDANVATDVVSEYRWNNIVLLDTPGILAGKVESHDQRTKEALKNSDLVVYVLTSQLFDDVIFNNFIDLAYNQQLKDKMLIVINKMSMEAGEFDILKDNYTESIKTIFKERDYEFDFNVVFIDAADYIEGKNDNDQEFIQLSNFNTFITTLNNFVEEKGLIKKQFDSPVRLLKGKISDIVLAEADPNLQIVLGQYKRQVINSKKDVENKVKLELANFKQIIIGEGQKLGNLIGQEDVDQQQLKSEEKKYELFVQNEIEEIDDRLKKIIEEEEQELFEEHKNLNDKEVIVAYRNNLEIKLQSSNLSAKERINLEKQQNYLNYLQKGGQAIAEISIKKGVGGLAKVSASSGTQMKNIVYSTGKFFGHKFKPWGATKLASKIGNAAKVIGVAASFIAIGLEIFQKHKEEKLQKEVRDAKNQFYTEIRNLADDIVREIERSFLEYIQNSYSEKIQEMDNQQAEIVKTQEINSKLSEMINKLDAEYIDFIEVVEKI